MLNIGLNGAVNYNTGTVIVNKTNFEYDPNQVNCIILFGIPYIYTYTNIKYFNTDNYSLIFKTYLMMLMFHQQTKIFILAY